jgi:hypothetical protein
MVLLETTARTKHRGRAWLDKRNDSGLVELCNDARQQAGYHRVEKAGGGWSLERLGAYRECPRIRG